MPIRLRRSHAISLLREVLANNLTATVAVLDLSYPVSPPPSHQVAEVGVAWAEVASPAEPRSDMIVLT